MADDTDSKDRLYVGPELSDGSYAAIRAKKDSLELGTLHTEISGHGDVVQLDHVEGCEYRVVDSIKPNAPGNKSGPVQVANSAYRSNWDAIFGAKLPVGQA